MSNKSPFPAAGLLPAGFTAIDHQSKTGVFG
jgi:hypothetical protein